MKPIMKLVLVVILIQLLVACDSDSAKAARSAEVDKILVKLRAAENEWKSAVSNHPETVQSMLGDKTKVKSKLSECKRLIAIKAKERNDSPFGSTVIDKYSADIYLFAAGSIKAQSDGERAESFLENSKDLSNILYGYLNTSYALLETKDSFSGPKKYIYIYTCRLDSNFIITSVDRDHNPVLYPS